MSFNKSGSKYLRAVPCITDGKIDVYAVLDAFGVTCPARQHAAKKILCSGIRGKGDTLQDLHEARDAVSRAIQMEEQRMNVELCSAGNYMPAPEPPGVYLHGTHCDTCARPDCARGEYPATKDGGCEGYVMQPITVPAPDSPRADSCTGCAHVSDQCAEYRQPDLPCGDFSAKDATTAADLCRSCITEPCPFEPAIRMCFCTAHTTAAHPPAPSADPAVTPVALEICPSCEQHRGCKGTIDPAADGSCKGFSQKETLDFNLPSIALDCTAAEAYQKYIEECGEVDKARSVLHTLIELWDCIQAIQTSIEKGGEWHTLYDNLMADMRKRKQEGNHVDLARRAMLMKNAARWRYSDEVNRLIIESNGHRFKEADA